MAGEMRVAGFAGYSGVGKTTLIERLIPALRALGQRVSVVKHAHHGPDVDHPGKDSFRHREAGAFEVVVASSRRLVLMREFECEVALTVHQMLADLSPVADWVLVEGFRDADIPKLELWRQEPGGPVLYPLDPFVVAVATDDPATLPEPTGLPVLDINDPQAVVNWMQVHAHRFDYRFPEPGAV